jgi:hypothetical protein
MIYFLSGLPRSGSTVLAAILNQHPLLHVTATSGIANLILDTDFKFENGLLLNTQGKNENEHIGVLKGMLKGKYDHINKPIVLDKSRAWPGEKLLQLSEKILDNPVKIIATVRDVADCAASFVRIAKPDNIGDFLINSPLIDHLKNSYIQLYTSSLKYPEKFLFIEYENLLSNPGIELEKIHKFLEIPSFVYDLKNIDGKVVKEDDEKVWKIPGLHDIKPVLQKQHSEDSKNVLGFYYDRFCQDSFWKPDYVREYSSKKHPLDIAKEKSLNGEIEESKKIILELLEKNPNDNRALFNLGLFKLTEGNLLEGMQMLNRGRFEKVWGNNQIETPKEIWDGKTQGTLFYSLEGGLGDEIHGLKYVKNLIEKGCKVIVGCSPELFEIVKDMEGINAVATRAASNHIYHDFWLPSMGAICSLGLEYSNIDGKPYLRVPNVPKRKKFTIGLRWQGNPQFEEDQLRLFDTKLLFDSVKGFDVDFINLQRDEGKERIPDWVEKLPLETWENTRDAIAQCDLIISSCTSVAHLAAAMGKQTYVLVPVLPYYIWAYPGDKSPFYDSVTLFRKDKNKGWEPTFKNLNKQLKNVLKLPTSKKSKR